MKKITFYFDFLSPYVWLAWKKIPELLDKHKLELNAVPVLFAGLLGASGQKGPAEIPSKLHFVWSDTIRLAHLEGYTLKGPPTHPFNPLPSLRLCEACDSKQKIKLAQRLANACWEEGKDISQMDVLITLANEVGLNGKELIQKINDPQIKEKIKLNTEEAIGKGAFGVPTFMVDDELFWGHDRLGQIDLYFQGKLKTDKNF